MGRCKAVPLMISLLLLAGCGGGGETVSSEALALAIQKDLGAMTSCSCQVALSADYETRVFDYVLDVAYDVSGADLTIVEPEIARGVTAHIQSGQTQLVYDGFSLDAGPLTADGLSPVEAVPAFYRAISEGYIAAVDAVGETLTVTYRDGESQPGVGLETVVTFDAKTKTPLWGELFFDGARIVTAQVKDFQCIIPQTE